jgi:hypothetical protein
LHFEFFLWLKLFPIRRVLFVADLFHPVDDLAVELFLGGDMRHGGGRRGAMPVLLARRKPDHVAGPDFLDRAALALRPAATGGDNQGLAQRMRVPRGARARFKRDRGGGGAPASLGWNKGSMRTVPVNQSAGPLAEGCEPFLLISMKSGLACRRINSSRTRSINELNAKSVNAEMSRSRAWAASAPNTSSKARCRSGSSMKTAMD